VSRYTGMSNQSGIEWPGQGGGCGECAQVHWYNTSNTEQQTVRERVIRPRGGACNERARVQRYTTSKQSRTSVRP